MFQGKSVGSEGLFPFSLMLSGCTNNIYVCVYNIQKCRAMPINVSVALCVTITLHVHVHEKSSAQYQKKNVQTWTTVHLTQIPGASPAKLKAVWL